MRISLAVVAFICLISCSLGMTRDTYGFQIVSQVGVDSADGSGALTEDAAPHHPNGPGWTNAGTITWTHVYDASNIGTITNAELTMDFLDADTGTMTLTNGPSTIAVFDPPLATQDNGGLAPGTWQPSSHANANNTTFTLDLPTFGSALLSGSFTIIGDVDQFVGAWGSNRAILTIDYESNVVPEPTTIALLGIGLAGLAGAEVRRRRKKKVVNKS